MAHLYKEINLHQTGYKDHKSFRQHEWQESLKHSSTLYVGNLSFYTTEEQIFEVFSKCGEIKRIIMGLDKNNKTPCGFCFVEYYTHEDALDCVKYINGTRLDDRIIRTELDAGFKEGRQYGRGKTGGQVRDEYRADYDPGRGGYGKLMQEHLTGKSKMGETYEPSSSTVRNTPQADSWVGGDRDSQSRKRTRESEEGYSSSPKRAKEGESSGRNSRIRDEIEPEDRKD